MKERYQDIDEKNEELREHLDQNREQGQDFLDRYEMSWIYHDSALEGVVFAQQELNAALHPGAMQAEASLMPIVLEIRNHKAVIDYIRAEARASGKKQQPLTVAQLKHIHDLFSGNTPEAQAARAATERRERSEKELAKEKEKSGFRKDMPLHRTYFHDIAQPAKIAPALDKLCEMTASSEFREFHPIKQAATVQHQFVQIFPSWRTAGRSVEWRRTYILLRHGYLPCVIHSIDRQRYYESFRGPVAAFRGLLMDSMENSLDNALKFFRDLSRKYKTVNSGAPDRASW